MQAITRPGALVVGSRPWDLLGKPGPSLLEALYPSATYIHKLAMALVMVGVLVGLGRARFFLPDNPVPIVFTGFGILLVGGALGWRWGLVSILIYYFLGMAGVPVFQGGGNGWAYVTEGVTGGYIIGWIVSVGLVGYLAQRGWNRGRSLWPMVLGMLVVYLPGLLWLRYGDFSWPASGELFSAGMYPFIPGDLVKTMLAALVIGLGWKIADRRAEEREEEKQQGASG